MPAAPGRGRRRTVAFLPAAIAALGLAACAGGAASRPGGGAGAQPPSGSAQPPPLAPPERPAAPVPRQFQLGAAAHALVSQAHQQAGGGDYAQAAATLERALRIEPDNPLLWIELGRVQLGENNPAQADAMGRKALTLASGDAAAQALAWHLVADAARARGRNADAYDAERRAQSLAPR
jgi:tetratricopeptide (TPR) repeat protein